MQFEAAPDSSESPLSASRKQTGGIRALSPKDAQAQLAELERLCYSPEEHSVQLDQLSALLRETGYKTESMQVITRALAAPEANPHVGALWIRRVVGSKTWDRSYPEGLDPLCERGEIGRRAVLELLEHAARKQRPRVLNTLLSRHAHWLRSHPVGWSLVVRSLASAGLHRKAVRWAHNWREARNSELLTLHALARCLRALGNAREARAVLEAAARLPGPDLEKAEVELWLATEEVLASETELAHRRLQGMKPVGFSEETLTLYYLVRGTVRVQQAPPTERNEVLETAHLRVADRFRGSRVYRHPRTLRRDYRRCMSRMARDAGRSWLMLKACWRAADSPWLLGLLLISPGLQLLIPIYLYRLMKEGRTPAHPLAKA